MHCLYLTDVGHFSKTAASDMTKAARAKFESRRTSQLSRSTEALPSCATEASSSEFQSRRRSSLQLRLFRSARHPSRSTAQPDLSEPTQHETTVGRSRRLKRRPRSHHDMTDEHSMSSDTSHEASSSTVAADSESAQRQRQSRAAESSTSQSQSAAHRLVESSRSSTQDTFRDIATQNMADGDIRAMPVTRRYRAPDVTMQMPFSSTTGRNVHISDDCRTACRQAGDFCNAYVFTQQPLMPGEELVLRITGTNVEYRGGLTVGLTACDPITLNVTDMPDDADKLLDRPEYWVVHKNICSHPKVNDELAFLRTLSGKF